MITSWILIVFLSLTGETFCGQYGKASSYHNQFKNSYEDDEYWPNYYSLPSKSSYKDEAFHPRQYPHSWSRFNDIYSDEFEPEEEYPVNELEAEKPIPRSEDYFSYDENDDVSPSRWCKINKNCSGNNQSPVILYESLTFRGQKASHPLTIEGFAKVPIALTATNSGHSIAVRLEYEGEPARISGGPLKSSYILDNIHWHWGENDAAGSEHALNGKRYAAEAHFVFYNAKFASLADAATQFEGLTVLGVFYELDNNVESSNSFIQLVPNVIEPEATYKDTNNVFCLRDLIKTEHFNYLSYRGSLTTPNCYETVTWLVSKHILKISSDELATLRMLKDKIGQPLVKNARPFQRLNRRKITSY